MKPELIEQLGVELLKRGFTVKTLTRTCFDIVARSEKGILLIKVLEDANAVTPSVASEMQRIAAYIDASPVVIANKADKLLQDNIVYARFDVYVLNFRTFRNCIENNLPVLFSTNAGITAAIIGEKLRRIRSEEGISLGLLATKVGVSKRMIQKYEDGQADVSLKSAVRLYKIFGKKIFREVNVFSSEIELSHPKGSDIVKKFDNLGFDAADTKKAPFDVVAKKGREIILTEIGEKTNPQLEAFRRILDADNLIIFKKEKPKKIPALTKKEFMDFDDASELIKFLKDFE